LLLVVLHFFPSRGRTVLPIKEGSAEVGGISNLAGLSQMPIAKSQKPVWNSPLQGEKARAKHHFSCRGISSLAGPSQKPIAKSQKPVWNSPLQGEIFDCWIVELLDCYWLYCFSFLPVVEWCSQ
jgi:hypothetical protein